MARKPIYEELKQRVMELEMESAKRIRAGKALGKEEREKEAILDSLTEHIVFHDTEHKVLWANRAAGESVDLAPEKLVGRYCYEIWQKRTKPCPGCPVKKAIESGQPQEAEMTTPDGRAWLIQGNPIRNENGDITGGVETTLEITKRKQAEEALRESEAKIGAMLQSIADHISMMDKDLNIIWANETAKRVFGNGIIGRKCYEAYHRRKKPCEPYPCLTLKAFQDENVHEHDTQVIDKDGKITYFHCTANVALRDKEGNPTAVIEISRDITEQLRAEEEKKQLEAQLHYAQKMEALGTLAGGIAHTFNNLLMAIVANTSVMLLEANPAHPHYEKLKAIERIVGNGSKLTKQLLEYAREGAYEIRTLSLNQVVKETSEALGTIRKDVTIHRELAEGLLEIRADQGQIEQVLWNLYVNAADAMPNGGDLFLKTMNITHKDMKDNPDKPKAGDYILVIVTDTGIGIDKETIKRIFDPFFTTKGLGAGTGLGLALVHGIIKAHGGYIEVDSQMGEGASFKIYLPASEKRLGKTVESSKQIVEGSEKFKK